MTKREDIEELKREVKRLRDELACHRTYDHPAYYPRFWYDTYYPQPYGTSITCASSPTNYQATYTTTTT